MIAHSHNLHVHLREHLQVDDAYDFASRLLLQNFEEVLSLSFSLSFSLSLSLSLSHMLHLQRNTHEFLQLLKPVHAGARKQALQALTRSHKCTHSSSCTDL
jgi:hypothetical protein